MSTFWGWWQQLPAKINPVVFEFNGFRVQYYGLMYIVAFAVTYVLVRHRLKHENQFVISVEHINNLMTFLIVGVIVGGRLGYVFFYNSSYYFHHPLEIFLPFKFSNHNGGSHSNTASLFPPIIPIFASFLISSNAIFK